MFFKGSDAKEKACPINFDLVKNPHLMKRMLGRHLKRKCVLRCSFHTVNCDKVGMYGTIVVLTIQQHLILFEIYISNCIGI